jgi:hypothetical protein
LKAVFFGIVPVFGKPDYIQNAKYPEKTRAKKLQKLA